MEFIGLDPIPPSSAIIEMRGTPLGFVDLHNWTTVRQVTIAPSAGAVTIVLDVAASVDLLEMSLSGSLVWEFHGVSDVSEERIQDGLQPGDFVEWAWWIDGGRSKVFIGLGDRELNFEASETKVSLE